MLLYFLFHGSSWEKFPHIILKPRVVIGHHAELLLSGVIADTSTISWKFIPEEEEVVNREEEPQVQKSEQWWRPQRVFTRYINPGAQVQQQKAGVHNRKECARGISALKLHSISRSVSDLQGSYHSMLPSLLPQFQQDYNGVFLSFAKVK